jgi:hypothetical protein
VRRPHAPFTPPWGLGVGAGVDGDDPVAQGAFQDRVQHRVVLAHRRGREAVPVVCGIGGVDPALDLRVQDLPICLRLKVDEVLVEVGPVRRQAWRSPRAWTAAGRSRRSRRRSRLLGSGRARRPSRTLASSRWAAPSAVGGGDEPEQQLRAGVVQRRKPSSSMRTSSLRSRVSMRRPTELSATPGRGSRPTPRR